MDEIEKRKALKKAYASGYRTGVAWNNEWRPGGPYSCCGFSRMLRSEWLRGFDRGFAKKEMIKDV